MNKAIRLMLVSAMLFAVMMIAVAPAFAGGEAAQMWSCELEDETTEAQVIEGTQKWLAAAKKVKGGENFEATVLFPVAVNATGEIDVMLVVTAPTFKEWGEFWDGYEGSEAAKIETANEEFAVCPDSVLWESMKVK